MVLCLIGWMSLLEAATAHGTQIYRQVWRFKPGIGKPPMGVPIPIMGIAGPQGNIGGTGMTGSAGGMPQLLPLPLPLPYIADGCKT